MKVLFIRAKSRADVLPVVRKTLRWLPQKVGLVTTAQHEHTLAGVKKFLEKNKVNAIIGGAVLGCDLRPAEKIKDCINAFLYIGGGEFHPLGIALATGKKVIIANPMSGNVSKITESDVEKFRKRKNGALLRFLSSKNIGILVSTKPGQENLKMALGLKRKFRNKKCYLFVADKIDFNEFENFPFIECWVNTACPRISDERTDIINISDIKFRQVIDDN